MKMSGELYQIGCPKCGELVRELESHPFLIQIEEGVFCVPAWTDLEMSGLACGCDEEDDPGVHWVVTELEYSIKPQDKPQGAGIDPQPGVNVGREREAVKLGVDCHVDYSVILNLLESYARNILPDLEELARETQCPAISGGPADEYEEQFRVADSEELRLRIEEMWTAIMHSHEGLIERAMWVSNDEIREARKGVRNFWS